MSLQLVTVVLLVAAAALFIGRSVRRTLRGDAAGDGCHDCGKPQQPRGLGYRRSRTGANEQKAVDPRESPGTFFPRSGIAVTQDEHARRFAALRIAVAADGDSC